MADSEQRLPLWGVTLGIFLVGLVMVITFFFWQSHRVKQVFLDHAQQHATLVSEIIRLNAGETLLTQQTIDHILKRLLGNTARFVAYLDTLEPFAEDELSVFARENTLAGIQITRPDRSLVQGPDGWLPEPISLSCKSRPEILHLPALKLYVLIWTDPSFPGCVVLGMTDSAIASLINGLGLDKVLNAVSAVPGILHIALEPLSPGDVSDSGTPVHTTNDQGQDMVQASLVMGDQILRVGVDAGHLTASINQLWLHMGLFSLCLVLTGLGLSVVLHRYQTSIVSQVRDYERVLASQREDAALGRSAAAIAHEIRNPLNALGMGLQRLELENTDLSEEHQILIRQMLASVHRANGSVTGLLRYARSRNPGMRSVRLDRLVGDVMTLYAKQCKDHQIRVTGSVEYDGTVDVDPDLMGQVIENILLNAIEAQPSGGFFHYSVKKEPDHVVLVFSNQGCTVSEDQVHRILEPYYTTRPQGTGLGMAIVSRILSSMNGQIQVDVDGSGKIEISIRMPVRASVDMGGPGTPVSVADTSGGLG